jgi:hypothetical protein
LAGVLLAQMPEQHGAIRPLRDGEPGRQDDSAEPAAVEVAGVMRRLST